MHFDFDPVIERRGTDCLKFDFAAKWGLPDDVLPLWVADMDFPAPPEVVTALIERSRHGIFGYSDAAGPDYCQALASWYQTRFNWQIRPEWLVKTPSVVFALCAAIRTLTLEGESILIQEPVYYPFRESVVENKRKLIVNRLIYRDGHYDIDFPDFEQKIMDHHVKLFILCNPHNPVGRVWTAEELNKMGAICLQHGVKIVADEIHQDFVYPGHRHLVFQDLQPEYQDCTITCTAPTKTFNLAGLQIANILIANPELRRRFKQEVSRSGYSQPNVMGLTACRAAYESGGPWLDALLVYLQKNVEFLQDVLSTSLPSIRLVEPQGTYLAWLDCRGLGLSDQELKHRIRQEARLWLSDGTTFGEGGSGFQRVNLACPRATLEEALNRLVRALGRGR